MGSLDIVFNSRWSRPPPNKSLLITISIKSVHIFWLGFTRQTSYYYY